jgi:predicted protein tyrosine phosphatase
VLFVCTRNAGRSQMAQAFFERSAPPDLRAESAGQDPAPRVRAIRDGIGSRVEDLLHHELEEIRSNPTAHRQRLERLRPPLIAEFGDSRGAARAEHCFALKR